MLEQAADAVARTIGAAVQAVKRAHALVEPHDHAVGARRRPGLVDAHRLDRAALQRLQEAAARRQGRRDPAVGRHLGKHVGAVHVLLEHEFDQPVARREQRKPCATPAGGRKPRGIARQPVEDRGASTRAFDAHQPVPPAFAHHDACAVQENPERKGEPRCDFAPSAAPRRSGPKRPGFSLQHQVRRPFARPTLGRAVGGIEGAVGREGDGRDADERTWQFHFPAVEVEPAGFQCDREFTVRRYGERRHRRVEGGDRLRPAMRRNGNHGVAAARQQSPVQFDQIVRGGEPAGERRVVELRVRAKRAVHRRNGHRLAAEEIEEGIEDHGFVPQ